MSHTSNAVPKSSDPFTRLYNIGLAVGSNFTLSDALRALHRESSTLVDTTNFAITIFDSPTNTLKFDFVMVNNQEQPPFRVSLLAHGLTSHVVSMQSPLIIHDLQQINNAVVEIDRITTENPPRTWLGAPIPNLIQPIGNAQGALLMWHSEPNAFAARDLHILAAIASQAAVSIRYVQMLEALHLRAMEMAIINDVAETLTSTLDLQKVLRQIMEQVENMLNVETGVLLLNDSASNSLQFEIGFGKEAARLKPFRIPRDVGIPGQVIETEQPVLRHDINQDELASLQLQNQFGFTVRNLLAVPLTARGQVIGVLLVLNKREDEFGSRDVELLQSMVPYASVAIENAQLHQSVLAAKEKVVEAGELARRELARNLHDGPVQLVSAIRSRLSYAEQALEKDPSLLPAEFTHLQGVADRAIHQMRTMMFELRPLVLETEGLAAALQMFLERRQQEITGSKLTFKLKNLTSDDSISRLDSTVETAIFAIVQEALGNAVKHAQAKNIIVQLTEAPEAFYVIIADDGQGFDMQEVLGNYAKRTSLGMVNIRERAALSGCDLQIKSAPGMGTHIFIYVPKTSADRQENRQRRRFEDLFSL